MTRFSRREFLSAALIASGAPMAVSALAQDRRVPTPADKLTPLDESGPFGMAMGYKLDAGRVDKARFKQFAAEQKCGTCRFYRVSAADPAGRCSLADRPVTPAGWCSAWRRIERKQ